MYLSNEDQAVYNIHDILKAYYKVALKRFIDTLVLQVVERHYLGNKGPVRYIKRALHCINGILVGLETTWEREALINTLVEQKGRNCGEMLIEQPVAR
jgi:hypothetical protein